jgi:hypothetical protein
MSAVLFRQLISPSPNFKLIGLETPNDFGTTIADD